MHKRFYSFLEQQNCFYIAQFGFHLRLSTKHQSQLDQNKFFTRVFADLKKTFDTVDLTEKTVPMEFGEQQMNSFDTVDLTEKTVPMELGEQEMNGFVHI